MEVGHHLHSSGQSLEHLPPLVDGVADDQDGLLRRGEEVLHDDARVAVVGVGSLRASRDQIQEFVDRPTSLPVPHEQLEKRGDRQGPRSFNPQAPATPLRRLRLRVGSWSDVRYSIMYSVS